MFEATIGFAAVLALVLLRVPIAFAMGLVGIVGYMMETSYRGAISMVARLIIDASQDYGLSVVPLFILMGLFVNKGGISRELYQVSYAFLGHLRGGLAMATAATMSKVAMPQIRLRRQSVDRFHRRWRHAWHPYSAVGNPRDLRAAHRNLDRQTVHRRHHSRLHRHRVLSRRRLFHGDPKSRSRSGRPAHRLARPAGGPQGRLGRAGTVLPGDRQPLRRARLLADPLGVLADGSGRHGCRRRLHHRPVAAQSELPRHARSVERNGAHRRIAVQRADRPPGSSPTSSTLPACRRPC